MNIIITILKDIDYKKLIKEYEDAENNDLEINFRVNHLPKKCNPGDKCFVVHNGYIKGYHIIHKFEVLTMNNGMDLLNKVMGQLDDKKGKKANQQKRKIQQYIKDNELVLPKKEKELNTDINIIFVNEDLMQYRKDLKRKFDEDGLTRVYKCSLIMFLRMKNIKQAVIYEELKQMEQLETQCLIYTSMKYQAIHHQLIINCELCWYAYKSNNVFCKRMVMALRVMGYGLKPYIHNPEWSK